MEYKKLIPNLYKQLQLGAGTFVKEFNIGSKIDRSKILFATEDGMILDISPNIVDLSSEVDMAPPGTKELIVLDGHSYKLTGRAVNVTPDALTYVSPMTSRSSSEWGRIITPANNLDSCFKEFWWVGDYSEVNKSTNAVVAGFVAIKFINSLGNGFSFKTSKEKGIYDFELTAHKSYGGEEPVTIYVRDHYVKPEANLLNTFILDLGKLDYKGVS